MTKNGHPWVTNIAKPKVAMGNPLLGVPRIPVYRSTFLGQLFVRTAVRTRYWYEVLRNDKNKDCARVKGVYAKYIKARSIFLPYLVRNSLLFRSDF